MATLDNFTVFECPGIQAQFANLRDPYLFQETRIIRKVHENVPRFGKTSNITPFLLFGLEDEEGTDYVEGLFAASIIIAIFMITWFICLGVLAFLGPKRVGLLSGRLLTLPSNNRSYQSNGYGNDDPSDDDRIHLPPANVYDNNTTTNNVTETTTASSPRRQRRALKVVRCTVLFCSLGIFICCIVMITKGIQSLLHSQQEAVSGISKGQELADGALLLIDTFTVLANETATASRELATQLNTNYCPAVRGELCPNLTEYLDSPYDEAAAEQAGTDVQTLDEICNFEGIPYADELETLLNARTEDWFPDSVTQMRQNILDVYKKLDNMQEHSGDYNWAFAVAAAFAAILSVLCLLIAYGVVEAWCGCTKNRNCLRRLFKYLRHWLLLPMFILFVVISWVFSMVFIIGSTASADLCFDSPDDRVAAMVIRYGNFQGVRPTINSTGTFDIRNVDGDSLILLFLLYYIEGCPVDSAPQDLINSISRVLTVLDESVDLVANVVSDPDLPDICGNGTANLLTSNDTSVFQKTLCSVGEALVELQTYFSCDNWRPLYVLVMYDAVCYNANDGFYFVGITQFLIVVFAMTMLTCRVAFTEVDFDKDEDGNDNRELEGLDNAAAAMAASPAPNDNGARMENAPIDDDDQRNHSSWVSPLGTGNGSQQIGDDEQRNHSSWVSPSETGNGSQQIGDDEERNHSSWVSLSGTGNGSQHTSN